MEEDKYTRITLRLPKDLHAKLQEQADATTKSMNAEIVARLEKTFNETLLAVNDESAAYLMKAWEDKFRAVAEAVIKEETEKVIKDRLEPAFEEALARRRARGRPLDGVTTPSPAEKDRGEMPQESPAFDSVTRAPKKPRRKLGV